MTCRSLDCDLLAAGETCGRLGGCAVWTEGGGRARTADGPLGVRFARLDVGHGDDDPPGGGQRRDLSVRQPRLRQLVGHRGAHCLRAAYHLAGRQLLQADLEQQGIGAVDLRKPARRRSSRRRCDNAKRVPEFVTAFGPQLRGPPGQVAHPGERTGAFGGADRAAGVQHVERVAGLEDVAVGRHRQAQIEQAVGFVGVRTEQLLVGGDVRVVQVVAAHLVLGLPEDLVVADAGRVGDLLEVVDTLQRHDDAFDAIGDLDRNGIQHQPPGLLEVGELGDLETVEPDLPAQAPGAERRRGPVVLDESDVMRVHVDAERLEAGQVHLLGVARVRLEDHLELGVGLQPVRVLAVPRVVGSDTGLDVPDGPRLRAEDAQHGGGVGGASTDLGVERLDDHRSTLGPESLQGQQHVLHGQRLRARRLRGVGRHDLVSLPCVSVPAPRGRPRPWAGWQQAKVSRRAPVAVPRSAAGIGHDRCQRRQHAVVCGRRHLVDPARLDPCG